MDDTTYRYESLQGDRRHFRLLRLLAGLDRVIRCEIITGFFDEPADLLPYEASSYTWGGLEKTEIIIVDDQMFTVTGSLKSALIQLQYEAADRLLWVDAICIDQSNDEERTHQVGQMRDIYREADRVLIWLGDETTSEVRDLLHFMRLLEIKSLEASTRSWTLCDERWKELWLNLLLEHDEMEREPYRSFPRGLQQLLTHAWFGRVWIIQELALSKVAIIMCGRTSVSARIFAVASGLLGERPAHSHEQEPQTVCRLLRVNQFHDGQTSSHEELLAMMFRRSPRHQPQDLLKLLLKFATSEASEPRDRIYALLGLCLSHHTGQQLPLVANYSIMESEVVGNVLVYIFGREFADGLPFQGQYYDIKALLRDLRKVAASALEQVAPRLHIREVRILLESVDRPVLSAEMFVSVARHPAIEYLFSQMCMNLGVDMPVVNTAGTVVLDGVLKELRDGGFQVDSTAQWFDRIPPTEELLFIFLRIQTRHMPDGFGQDTIDFDDIFSVATMLLFNKREPGKVPWGLGRLCATHDLINEVVARVRARRQGLLYQVFVSAHHPAVQPSLQTGSSY